MKTYSYKNRIKEYLEIEFEDTKYNLENCTSELEHSIYAPKLEALQEIIDVFDQEQSTYFIKNKITELSIYASRIQEIADYMKSNKIKNEVNKMGNNIISNKEYIKNHMSAPARVWIVSPSKSSPFNEHDGKTAIALPPDEKGIHQVYFTEGEPELLYVPSAYLRSAHPPDPTHQYCYCNRI